MLALERMDFKITERQQALLRMIVAEYIATAAPVGSDTIVRKYYPGVSPATVRHDMNVLAAAGYVYHPHPSAGRVPSDEGYRYYVRHLMQPVEIPLAEQRRIGHLFHQVERDSDQWMQLAARVLAQVTGYAAVVTLPLVRRSRLRHLDLIATQDHAAVLVAMFQEGTVHRNLVVQSERLDQRQLDAVAQHLNRELCGMPAADIQCWERAQTPLESSVRDTLTNLMKRVDQQAVPGVWYDGISSLLAEPEFARGEKAQEVVRTFEQRQFAAELAEAVLEQAGVRVMIGDEVPWPSLRECAIVATSYGRGGVGGAIGVVGPTRLRYEQVIASVQYLSALITDLWAELCQ